MVIFWSSFQLKSRVSLKARRILVAFSQIFGRIFIQQHWTTPKNKDSLISENVLKQAGAELGQAQVR